MDFKRVNGKNILVPEEPKPMPGMKELPWAQRVEALVRHLRGIDHEGTLLLELQVAARGQTTSGNYDLMLYDTAVRFGVTVRKRADRNGLVFPKPFPDIIEEEIRRTLAAKD